MKTRKGILSAGALFMGLVVMLGLIGLVNGLWSKNLVIHGTVETGDLNADWDCGWTNDDGLVGVLGTVQGGGCADTVLEPAGDTGLDPNNFDWPNFVDHDPFVRKDVGECHLEIGDRNTGENSFGDQVAYVTITNAYPSYECSLVMFLTNTGSIPFNVISADLKLPAGQAPGVLETGAVGANGEIVDLCDPSTLQDVQVDPGEELPIRCTVHVTELAAQSTCTGATTTTASGGPTVEDEVCDPATTYSFAIDVCVAQWNEAATAAQCKGSAQHEGPAESFLVRVSSPTLSFGPNGWGGWSCPAGTHVVGGGYEPGSATVQVSEAAQPGSISGLYPVYPHYTFPAGETGWVVQNDNDGEAISVFAICAPN